MKFLIIFFCAVLLSSQVIAVSQPKKNCFITPTKIVITLLIAIPTLFATHAGWSCIPCIINNPYTPAFSSTHIEPVSTNYCLPCISSTTSESISEYIKANPYPKNLDVAFGKKNKKK